MQGSNDAEDDAMNINLYITTCENFIQSYLMDWVAKVKSCCDVAKLISNFADLGFQ